MDRIAANEGKCGRLGVRGRHLGCGPSWLGLPPHICSSRALGLCLPAAAAQEQQQPHDSRCTTNACQSERPLLRHFALRNKKGARTAWEVSVITHAGALPCCVHGCSTESLNTRRINVEINWQWEVQGV